ncbi:response regulator [Parazoarcus communis]|uniref:Response regulator n=1 Tax=Parazoarcus communis TaxID=41977 RepID=A0A2U8GM33_9RHOO|nr:response regulator [Parazoarcus communis]AWI74016.1 response regulator [Parazoarcus communis]|tara:strand:+ start:121897 stop:122280 length:384 start_codon:yes stop_codon:yes gene_type:complete
MSALTFIVDDNSINRKLASALIKRLGWSTEEFDGAEPMRARLTTVRRVTMLLDTSIPGISGLSACERSRGNPDWSDLHIVACTAHAMPHERDRFLNAGFDDILIKPVNLTTMAQEVGSADTPRALRA